MSVCIDVNSGCLGRTIFSKELDFTPAVNNILLIQIQISDVTLCFIATALFCMAKNDHTQQVAWRMWSFLVLWRADANM